jgi:hypothetical protein
MLAFNGMQNTEAHAFCMCGFQLQIDDQSVARALLLNPLDVYPPEFIPANPKAPNVFTTGKPLKPEFGESEGMHM